MDKGYTAPADFLEESIIMSEVLADPEGEAAYREFERLYAFKKAIIAARKAKQMTQQDVAAASGLTQQMVSKIESGNYYCNFASVLKYLSVVDPEKSILTV